MKKYPTEILTKEIDEITVRTPLYRRIFANRYLLHNILILGTNILAGVFAYLLHPFLAHIMSIQEYGEVAALISLSLVLTTPTQIITTISTKYASSTTTFGDKARLNDFIRRLTKLLFIVGIIITSVFVVLSSYVANFFHLNSQSGVIILSFMFVVMFVTPLNQGILQGLEYFNWFAVVTLLSAFLRLALSVGFVLLGLSVNGVMLAIILSMALSYLASFKPLSPILRGPRPSAGSLRNLWSYSLLASAAAGGLVFLGSSDTILASHFLDPRDVGLYAALATIGRTIVFVSNSVTTVMFPRVASLYERGESYLHSVLLALLSALVLSGVGVLIFYLAPSLVIKLLFGQAFLVISGQLAPYGLAMLLLTIAMVLINFFLAIGNRHFMFIILSACILQTGLIVWRHDSVQQIVQDVLISNVILVLALSFAFMLNLWKMPKKLRDEGANLEESLPAAGL